MAFNLIAIAPVDLNTARWCFNVATSYLRQSDMAGFIINQLQQATENITINVRRDGRSEYTAPAMKGPALGGTINWNMRGRVGTIDCADDRPAVQWIPQGGDRNGILSVAMCLLHEMGHAYQYLSNKEEFRALIDEDNVIEIENVNVNAIENTVALELTGIGCVEGIRWDYWGQRAVD